MRLTLGSPVQCRGAPPLRLADVVVDARGNRVTHVVVSPAGPDDARLVPLELVAAGDPLSLRCDAAALDGLEPVRAHADLPPGEGVDGDPRWDAGIEDYTAIPGYAPSSPGEYPGNLALDVHVAYDRIPKGEIELRRTSSVYSADEHRLGSLHGLDVDGEGRITSVLLERGHLWWRREVAVPAAKVAAFESDLVTLAAARSEIGGSSDPGDSPGAGAREDR